MPFLVRSTNKGILLDIRSRCGFVPPPSGGVCGKNCIKKRDTRGTHRPDHVQTGMAVDDFQPAALLVQYGRYLLGRPLARVGECLRCRRTPDSRPGHFLPHGICLRVQLRRAGARVPVHGCSSEGESEYSSCQNAFAVDCLRAVHHGYRRHLLACPAEAPHLRPCCRPRRNGLHAYHLHRHAL